MKLHERLKRNFSKKDWFFTAFFGMIFLTACFDIYSGGRHIDIMKIIEPEKKITDNKTAETKTFLEKCDSLGSDEGRDGCLIGYASTLRKTAPVTAFNLCMNIKDPRTRETCIYYVRIRN